ncbi:MAG: hypothetical protein LAT76_06895 [Schleiferiaceae bacterium]|nr:hypothetical protein [Schleiferiaceae bacterium]
MNTSNAQKSRAAIERLYITMRHLFMRGSYKPMGISGASLRQALLDLSPEIYGLINSSEKVELDGLLYVMERLPKGIEECRLVRLISREGYENGHFTTLFPPKRRRKCYRIDDEQMYVEMTRGRSDIYDILTHLTFLYMEADVIRNNSTDSKGRVNHDWLQLEQIVLKEDAQEPFDYESACSYLSHIVGRTFEETHAAALKFDKAYGNSIFHVVYHLGKLAIQEIADGIDREIFFSATLRERVGQHVYGDKWSSKVKEQLISLNLHKRPLHVVSANLHSFVNAIYGHQLYPFASFDDMLKLATEISLNPESKKAKSIKQYALKHGLVELPDQSGTNIGVQIIDTAKLKDDSITYDTNREVNKAAPVYVVMDYAFGEQAFECMDELLKFHETTDRNFRFDIRSISIMGKAGILTGKKGDLMVPSSHIFEGTADNYPFQNGFVAKDFEGYGIGVYAGSMVTVLGTSLQNKDVLNYFMESSWKTIGLEMEGAHYQKAIQSASKIRNTIRRNVKVFYAYYASDNPLETGSTLASGGLGLDGILPTYLVTWKILHKTA